MNKQEIQEILKDVQYKGWNLIVGESGQTIYLQFQWDHPCRFSNTVTRQHSRKWQLSQHMTKSELVQTAFKAALTAEEHECREAFSFKGAAIFGPHLSVDILVHLAQTKNLDYRKPMPQATMEAAS